MQDYVQYQSSWESIWKITNSCNCSCSFTNEGSNLSMFPEHSLPKQVASKSCPNLRPGTGFKFQRRQCSTMQMRTGLNQDNESDQQRGNFKEREKCQKKSSHKGSFPGRLWEEENQVVTLERERLQNINVLATAVKMIGYCFFITFSLSLSFRFLCIFFIYLILYFLFLNLYCFYCLKKIKNISKLKKQFSF